MPTASADAEPSKRTVVPWAKAGVGAVATQSFVEPAYGYKGLELMRSGVAAPVALERLLAADAQRNGGVSCGQIPGCV